MLCCGDSENTESVLNAHNYIIKRCNLGAFVRFGAWRYAGRTLISLISETMMGTFRAFHLMIKELLSEGEPRPCRYLIKLWSENWSHLRRLRRTRDKKVKRERKKEDEREKRCEAFEDIIGFNGFSFLLTVCVCVGGCVCVWVCVWQPPELQRFHYYRGATEASWERERGREREICPSRSAPAQHFVIQWT